MQNLFKSLPESIRQTVSAGAPLVIVIILFMVVGRFGIAKVREVRSEVESAGKTEETLTQKLTLLKTLSFDVAREADMASSALPDANPSLAVTSQLKNLALTQGVVPSAMKSTVGVADDSGINQALISFTLDGAREQVFSYLVQVAKIAPITSIKKVVMNESAGGITADINVVSFWAELPKVIPAVDAPITDLTAADKQILTDISGLTQPTFSEVAPSGGEINTNPFGE